MTKKLFSAFEFTATAFDTAEDKAKFANHFVRFVEADFPASIFPKWFYTRLSMTFGHIAHYDISGFYGTWFANDRTKHEFLTHELRSGGWGDPAYTYVDVERALKGWIIKSGLVETYAAKISAATEKAERATLAALKAKYERA